ncbi:MAG TPA: tail fiber domain-containing protein, partial [Syntrophales bacterium]|nr:tail fiber domain-containing protein [Syntrophales bacterium]
NFIFIIFFFMLFVHLGTAMTVSAEQAASVEVGIGSIIVTPATPGVTFMMLRVADPQGEVIGEQSSEGDSITWTPPAGAQEGLYTYEVRVGFGERNRMREDPQQQAPLTRPWRQSGTVYVTGSSILSTDSMERSFLDDIFSGIISTFAKFMDCITTSAYADQVFSQNVIISGSLAVGIDAVNGESFGYDTIRLKENNLRINFYDTSNSGSFPSNDWRIIINDSTNGGGSYFGVEDSTAGVMPFRIEAGAPANSLYIEDYGRVGLGTSLPVVELHIADGDTPTVRLDQDGSSGWAPQKWDVAGNETNFFVRDVTNGSLLPFRIIPGTPSNTLCLKKVDNEGRIGIGFESYTKTPEATLHVEGNALIEGNLELGSSRDYKENIHPLLVQDAMNTLKELRPVRFNYKINPDEESVGFIAEEVPDLVATNSRKSLSTMDVVAVLAKVTQEQQKVIEQLSTKIIDLEKELKAVSHDNSSGKTL